MQRKQSSVQHTRVLTHDDGHIGRNPHQDTLHVFRTTKTVFMNAVERVMRIRLIKKAII
jgi:hypothetical protein